MNRVVIWIMVLAMASPNWSFAGGCNISQPARQRVQYQNSYNAHALQVQQKVVQFDYYTPQNIGYLPASNLGLQYYYRVREDFDQDDLADKVATKVVTRLSSEGYVVHKDDPVSSVPNPGNNTPVPPPPPADNGDDGIAQKVLALFKSRCTSCHSGDNPSGGLVLLIDGKINQNLAYDGRSHNEERWTIFDRVDGSDLDTKQIMPKNGDPLSNDEVKLIREWARGA